MLINKSNPTIINIRSLWKANPIFDQNKFDLVKNAVFRNKGKVINVVHPLYCENYLNNPKRLDLLNSYKIEISSSGYSVYLNLLMNKIRHAKAPVFIFAAKINPIKEWILDNFNRGIFIMIRTRTTIDPNPALHNDNGSSWSFLRDIYERLYISHVDLTGEITIKEDQIEKGCVYFVRNRFSAFTFMKARVIPELTFPNLILFSGQEYDFAQL